MKKSITLSGSINAASDKPVLQRISTPEIVSEGLNDKLDTLLRLLPFLASLRVVIGFAQRGVQTIRGSLRSGVRKLTKNVGALVDDAADATLLTQDAVSTALIPSPSTSGQVLGGVALDFLVGALHTIPVVGPAVAATATRGRIEQIESQLGGEIGEIEAELAQLWRVAGQQRKAGKGFEKKVDSLEERIRSLLQTVETLQGNIHRMREELIAALAARNTPVVQQLSIQDLRGENRSNESERWEFHRQNPQRLQTSLTLRRSAPYTLPPSEELTYGRDLDVSKSGIVRTPDNLWVGGDFKADHCPHLQEVPSIARAYNISLTNCPQLRELPVIDPAWRSMESIDLSGSHFPSLDRLVEGRDLENKGHLGVDHLYLFDTNITELPEGLLPDYIYIAEADNLKEFIDSCVRRKYDLSSWDNRWPGYTKFHPNWVENGTDVKDRFKIFVLNQKGNEDRRLHKDGKWDKNNGRWIDFYHCRQQQ